MTAVLAGRRILVPRAEGSAGAAVDALVAAGAVPVAVPLLAIGPPADEAALDVAVLALAAGDYGWVGFVSAHGVGAIVRRAGVLGVGRPIPADTRIAAVGGATAAALRAADLPVDLVPSRGGSAAALADVWPHPAGDVRVLLPASEIGLLVLRDRLQDKGYAVDWVAAYAPRSVPVPTAVAEDLRSARYSAVLLTSPSLAAVVAGTTPHPDVLMIAIGATTAAAAAGRGLSVAAVADEPTPAGLLAALTWAIVGSAADRSPP